MKIAIEAVNANKPPEHGSETYLYNLIRSLLALDRDNRYYLYIDRPVDEQARFRQENVVYRHVRERRYLYGIAKRTLFDEPWSEFFLALDMLFVTRPDIFIFIVSGRLPFLCHYRTICMAHDLSEHVIGDCYSDLEREEFLRTKRRALRAATHIAALSEQTRADAIRFVGIPEEKITVIYPGYDRTVFNTLRDEGRFERLRSDLRLPGRYIMTTGMIHPKKNLVRLARAFRSIKAVGKFDGSLLIVGPDKYRGREIRQEISRLADGGDIVFAGRLPVGDMAEMLKGAALFAFPALYEGFGLSLLEAMACGAPSVAARAGALPEVAAGTARLFDPLREEDMASAMAEALNDAGLREKLRAGALRRAEFFSWEKTARQYLEIFSRSPSGSGEARP